MRVVTTVDAGTVDRDVEAIVLAHGDRDGAAHRVLVMHVSDHVLRCAARVLNQRDGLLQRRGGAAGDRHA